MIDYRAHASAFEGVRKSLAAESWGDPAMTAARDETLADVALAPDHALLGAFVDHLFTHAVSDGTEIALLERSSALWGQGLELYELLGSARKDLESALANPGNPASADLFNGAAMDSQRLAQGMHALQASIFSLRDDIAAQPHLPDHPRQLDEPASNWDWGNFHLARRTDAFARTLADRADDPATRAFAFGALTAYGGNACGSAYVGHVVGGPRRAHRFRDRLARNTLGSWIAAHDASIESLATMSQRLQFGAASAPTLPAAVETLIQHALSGTFDLTHTQPVPDLQLGYRRLVRHLELLDDFVRPSLPDMPMPVFTAKLFGDPANPPPTIRPQDATVTGDTGGGVSVGTNTPGEPTPGKDDSKKTSGSVCGAILALLILFAILLVVAFIKCVIEWADGKKCNYFEELGDLITGLFKKDEPDPRDPPTSENPGMSSAGLTAFAGTDQAVQLVGYLWDMQIQLWEALENSYSYLAATGLIYPDGLLELPLYEQFTAIPGAGGWPHRPAADSGGSYHLYPTSPLENPTETPSPFPSKATPNVFAAGQDRRAATPAGVALPVWEQIARGDLDSPNLDLDADRGFQHQCWSTGGSIDDDPLNVVVLGYDEH